MRCAHAWMIIAAAACGPQVGVVDEGGGTGSEDTTGGSSATMSTSVSVTDPSGNPTSATSPSTTAGSATQTQTSADTNVDDVTSIDGGCLSDLGGGVPFECDPFAEDCPCDEKCMPWANDGGSAWNALMCTPVAPDPKQVGESCTVEGSGVSGIDDCDIHSMCWDVDPETNMGECVAFCTGSAKEAGCAEECAHCAIANDGVLTLCFPTCDPLALDCPQGQNCLPMFEGFACVVDASGDSGVVGDPCPFVNGCDPGLMCLDASYVPGCMSAGCCTTFCDVTDAEPCAGGPPGTFCQLWFELGVVTNCDNPNLGACIDMGG